MLDLATTVTNSGSWRPTLLPSFIVMRYVYDPGTDALGESILGMLQLLFYYSQSGLGLTLSGAGQLGAAQKQLFGGQAVRPAILAEAYP